VSGAENGAERAEKLVSGSGAVSGTSEKKRGAERSAERVIVERERSAERVKYNVINFLKVKTCVGNWQLRIPTRRVLLAPSLSY
jgi:hypothetical protein